ncbi:arylsulfatase [Candidatus Poribacteria bacterium]|nr:arylsulfatase [Candidatus Poribacteria bacterium]
MDRRRFLYTLGVGTAGVMALGGSAVFGKYPNLGGRKPNIIFILADDLGYGDLGCYGQRLIETPNIDALAAEGIRFTQCYAGSTVCAPSRCALMTGFHMGHARVRGNKLIPLRPRDVTVAEILKGAGYTTAIIGKWGLGEPGTTGVPNLKGFDEWFGYLNQRRAHNYYPEYLWRNMEKYWIKENMNGKKGVYSHDLFTEEALKFIRRNRGNPFFLYLAYTIPHANNELGRKTGNGMEVPSDEPYSDRSWPQVEKNFAAMVTRMDRDVGRIVSLLKELGIDGETVIFFSSDNGPHREGGHDPKFFKSSGPLRGIKRDLYEGGIRVPMIVRWPGKIKPGSVSDQVWAFWDFLPTAAEIAGVESPRGIDGISMLPALLGKEQGDHEYLYWEFYERGFDQAVRMGDWKGVRHLDRKIELYNLSEDIGERRNIAADHLDIVNEISKIMREAHLDSPNFPIPRRR